MRVPTLMLGLALALPAVLVVHHNGPLSAAASKAEKQEGAAKAAPKKAAAKKAPSKAAKAKPTPARELFGAVKTPAPLAARSIGFYAKGCLAGASALPIDGPTWQA